MGWLNTPIYLDISDISNSPKRNLGGKFWTYSFSDPCCFLGVLQSATPTRQNGDFDQENGDDPSNLGVFPYIFRQTQLLVLGGLESTATFCYYVLFSSSIQAYILCCQLKSGTLQVFSPRLTEKHMTTHTWKRRIICNMDTLNGGPYV